MFGLKVVCFLCPLTLLFCYLAVLCFMSHSAGKNLSDCSRPVDLFLHMPHKTAHLHMHAIQCIHMSASWAERRQPFSLCGLYVSADPALIQQTKLSLLNAQQKSSLSRHYAAVAPCSPSIHRPPSSPHIHSLTLTPGQCIHYTNCARRTLTVCMFCFSKNY